MVMSIPRIRMATTFVVGLFLKVKTGSATKGVCRSIKMVQLLS